MQITHLYKGSTDFTLVQHAMHFVIQSDLVVIV